MRDGADVGVRCRGGVGAGALEQHQVAAAGFARGAHGFVDLAGCGHAGGHDDGLAGGRHTTDQRQVGVLERGDLVGRHVQRFEKVHRTEIERRAEAVHAVVRGALHDGCVPFPGCVGLLVELVELATGPQALGVVDHEAGPAQVQRHGVGRVGLQLDGVRPVRGGGVHDGQRALQRLVVVARHLGDQVGAVAGADVTVEDLHRVFSLA